MNAGKVLRTGQAITMLFRFPRFLGQSNIGHVGDVAMFVIPHQHILSPDISVDVSFGIHLPEAKNKLIRKQ